MNIKRIIREEINDFDWANEDIVERIANYAEDEY
jgi:hypothetical protein